MKNYIFTCILLTSFIFSNDEYPYFTDASKQLKFEKLRIYVYENSGEKTITSGGGSHTQMANPLQVLLLDETPQYISVTSPIKTSVEYWYNFEIKQNNKLLTEVELLKIVGLTHEAKNIIDEYTANLEDYRLEVKLGNLTESNTLSVRRGWLGYLLTRKDFDNTQYSYMNIDKFNRIDPGNNVFHWITFFSACAMIGTYMDLVGTTNNPDFQDAYDDYLDDGNEWGDYNEYQQYIMKRDKKIKYYKISLSMTLGSLAGLISNKIIKTNKKVTWVDWKHPEYKKLKQPKLEQTLSADQIKSLSDSYNRKIYTTIKEESK